MLFERIVELQRLDPHITFQRAALILDVSEFRVMGAIQAAIKGGIATYAKS